jgi:radical SAM protein with 4Fe4S-binding SPASM domain
VIFFPHIIHVDVSGHCNLRCKHCRGTWRGLELTFQQWERCLAPIFAWPDDQVKWVTIGGGEPLLYDELPTFVSFVTGFGARTLLTTNGTLLTPARLGKLLDRGLSRVQISLDSPTKEIHEQIRGKGTYIKAIKAMTLCHRAGVDFSVRMTLNRFNYHQIEEFVILVKELGAFEAGLRKVVPIGSGASNFPIGDISKIEYRRLLEQLPRLENTYHIRIYSGDPLALVANNAFIKEVDSLGGFADKKVYAGCSFGISYLYINSNGIVRPCPMIPFVLGDLKKDDFWTLWRDSPFFKQIRGRNYSKCRDCRMRFSCGGCRAFAYAATGNYWGTDPTCWLDCSDKNDL